MTRWLAALVAMLATSIAPAQYRPAPPAIFTDADNGRVVRLPVGAELVVRLPEQAGTAYEWSLKYEYRIREIGEPRIQDISAPAIVGGNQLRTFRIQVTAGGRIPLVFTLRSTFPDPARKLGGRVVITVDASSARFIPSQPDDAPAAQVIRADEAGGIFTTKLGQPVEIHLPADTSAGYRWEVISSRNIAFDAPPGIERKPGIFGLGKGDMTVIRLRTTIDRSDGFLMLGWMPPGPASPGRAAKMLHYQFHNQR